MSHAKCRIRDVLPYMNLCIFFAEPPAFEVLPSLKRLKQRVTAAGRGQYDAVFMSGRYNMCSTSLNFDVFSSFYRKLMFRLNET